MLSRMPKLLTSLRCSVRYISSVVQTEKFEKIEYKNEPVLEYLEGSKERDELEAKLEHILLRTEEVPMIIQGKEMISNRPLYQTMPHKHSHCIAKYFYAEDVCIKQAVEAAIKAQKAWDTTPITDRINIWEKAADLMATKYRAELIAASMLGQAKTVMDAEMDITELINYTRMNTSFLKSLLEFQPISPNSNTKNSMHLRGMEGFVAAISPFNATSIAGNSAYTPALMGNTVVWKPSDNAILSNWTVVKIMREAGLPDCVVNFIPADPLVFNQVITRSDYLAGVNFTGTLNNFQHIWRNVANQLKLSKGFPRLIGDCGGKNFHFVHQSANTEAVIACTVRAAFEYSGQKCSSCSRLYVPEKLWKDCLQEKLINAAQQLKIGCVTNFSNFSSAVINEGAFLKCGKYIDRIKLGPQKSKLLLGGTLNNLHGYFVDPTIATCTDPNDILYKEEIFGPVLIVYPYKEKELDKIMTIMVEKSPYALTGSIFAQDENFLKCAIDKFRHLAGNLYINDKCNSAVVGQQPLGGSRLSGTNDKAGGPFYLLRWSSMQTIKESLQPQVEVVYPCMGKTSEEKKRMKCF